MNSKTIVLKFLMDCTSLADVVGKQIKCDHNEHQKCETKQNLGSFIDLNFSRIDHLDIEEHQAKEIDAIQDLQTF